MRKFDVGGTGPKLNELLQMREKHLLQDRIELLGAVRHSDAREVSQGFVTLELGIDHNRIGSRSGIHLSEYLADRIFRYCYP